MSQLQHPRDGGAEVGHPGVGGASMHPPQGPATAIPTAAKKNRPKKRPTTRAGRRGEPRLSIKQLLFVDECLVDFVGSKAAVRAGCAEKSAAVTAAKEIAVHRMPEGGTTIRIKARDPLPALKLLAERREKEKAAKQDEEGPRHFGTIFYFDRGAKVKATIETQPNDSNDRPKATAKP